MQIYMIRNLVNNKVYIGQTVNNFNRRYNDTGEWWKCRCCNKHLKNATLKYGKENFEVTILKDEVSSEEELNRLEMELIKQFNSIYPNGYNYQAGGQLIKSRYHHQETCDKISTILRKGRDFSFKNSNGEAFSFPNLAAFCRKHELSRVMMLGVDSGKYRQHKGWTRIDVILKEKMFTSPSGMEYLIKDRCLRPFCRKFSLHHGAMIEVWKGRVKQHKGWTKHI